MASTLKLICSANLALHPLSFPTQLQLFCIHSSACAAAAAAAATAAALGCELRRPCLVHAFAVTAALLDSPECLRCLATPAVFAWVRAFYYLFVVFGIMPCCEYTAAVLVAGALSFPVLGGSSQSLLPGLEGAATVAVVALLPLSPRAARAGSFSSLPTFMHKVPAKLTTPKIAPTHAAGPAVNLLTVGGYLVGAWLVARSSPQGLEGREFVERCREAVNGVGFDRAALVRVTQVCVWRWAG